MSGIDWAGVAALVTAVTGLVVAVGHLIWHKNQP